MLIKYATVFLSSINGCQAATVMSALVSAWICVHVMLSGITWTLPVDRRVRAAPVLKTPVVEPIKQLVLICILKDI